ncbi:hypothetical protein [Streptomyces carpaticus]|uniref:Secreted protein n=1 Tax=Streptomyces carpaticus TaxID=285558 RepID=A0ABV4ZG00_9ACTN
MTDGAFGPLEKALEAADHAAVLAALTGLTDRDRRALAKPLRAYRRRWQQERDEADQWLWNRGARQRRAAQERQRVYARGPALRLAGAGVLRGPEELARWLTDWRFFQGNYGEGFDAELTLLRERGADWLRELAERLALRIDDNARPDLRPAMLDLLADTGVTPPPRVEVVRMWVHRTYDRRFAAAGLGADPLLDAMVPLLFSVDELGELLENGPFAQRLVAAAADGRPRRSVLLDGALRRLLRGGRPSDLRGYLRLYALLEVTVEEAAERIRELSLLLPDAPSPVAAVAQAELRRLDEAGRLTAEAVCGATEVLLFRPERKLAAAQLSWLAEAVPRHRDRAAELLTTAGAAFAHASPDVARRATRLVLRHAAVLPPAAAEELSVRAESLPADLRSELGPALGIEVSAPDTVAPPLLPVLPVRTMPPPIGSLAELAEEVAQLLTAVDDSVRFSRGSEIDPPALERVLEAVVAAAYRCRPELLAALSPVLDRYGIVPGESDARLRATGDPLGELQDLLGAATGPVRPVDTRRRLFYLPSPPERVSEGEDHCFGTRLGRWRHTVGRSPGPVQVLLHRLREIAIGLAHAPVPMLVATPTAPDGSLEAAVLTERLERAAREGWAPWEYDLQLALLRLPPEPEPQLAERATRIGSAAGDRLAEWLSFGAAGAAVTRPGGRRAIRLRLAAEPARPGVPAAGEDTLLTLLTGSPDAHRYLYPRAQLAVYWPTLWPSRPEVMAAFVMPALPGLVEHGANDGSGMIAQLAESPRAGGPVLLLAVTLTLSARGAEDRAVAVDALLTLAAGGRLDGAELGAELAARAARREIKLSRVVPALREAAGSGAYRAVWEAVAAALPVLLAEPPHRLADLVALGAECAVWAGARAPVPGLEGYAARRGSTRLVSEARRLRDILAAAS